MKRIYVLIISLILLSDSVQGQTDSTIVRYPNKMFSPFVMYRNFNMQLDTVSFQNQALSIGARIRFKKFSLSLSIPIINKEQLGSNEDIQTIGLNSDLFWKRHTFHFVGRYYDIFPELPALGFSQPIGYIHVQSSHILSQDFSYRSAFRLYDRQLTSKGGFTFSPELFYYFISPEASIGNTETQFLQARTNLGYAYNFILKKHYFLSIYLNTGYAWDYSLEREGLRLISHHFMFLTNAKFAFGYQDDKYAWSIISNYTPSQFQANNFSTSNLYIGFMFGFRLNSTFKE